MSRSYHANRSKVERLKKQEFSYKNRFNHTIDLKRLEGELEEKKHTKRKVKQFRKAKKMNIDLSSISDGNSIQNIKISQKAYKNIVFPVTKSDIEYVISKFRIGELIHVKEIVLNFINRDENILDEDENSHEIVPGVRSPYIMGNYNPETNKINISGLIISDDHYDFINHIMFYYKVQFLATVAHEIIHNIDFNSSKLRKGYKNYRRDYGTEDIAYDLTLNFYLDNIVPYVKEKYKDEYHSFMLWMEKQGVKPLEIQFWQPTLFDFIVGYDGIDELFKYALYGETEVKKNLNIAEGMHLGENIERAMVYIDYVLNYIDPNNYEALKLKAHILRHEENKYKEAEQIYKELYERNPEDSGMLWQYADVLTEQRKYESAYHIYKKIRPDKYEIIDYMRCLWVLKKNDELDMLIDDIAYNDMYIGGVSHFTLLMFAFAIKRDYKSSLLYFKSLEFERVGYFERSWINYVAAKIYLVKKDYDKVSPLLKDDRENNYFEISCKMKRLRDKMLKRQMKKI